jgi:hypothetical protein
MPGIYGSIEYVVPLVAARHASPNTFVLRVISRACPASTWWDKGSTAGCHGILVARECSYLKRVTLLAEADLSKTLWIAYFLFALCQR